jgi:hypothetical protein
VLLIIPPSKLKKFAPSFPGMTSFSCIWKFQNKFCWKYDNLLSPPCITDLNAEVSGHIWLIQLIKTWEVCCYSVFMIWDLLSQQVKLTGPNGKQNTYTPRTAEVLQSITLIPTDILTPRGNAIQKLNVNSDTLPGDEDKHSHRNYEHNGAHCCTTGR